jgi:hypothetical protein
MDGAFYNDLRSPFISGDLTAVNLATTDKALYTPSAYPVLGGQYFSYIGKKQKIRMMGKVTTGATPGNGQFDIYYGTGADANGVLLQSSAAFALLANQSNISWWAEFYIRCQTTGSAGTLFCDGIAFFNQAVAANIVQPILIPASGAAVSAACDLTAALIISVQFKRSGSTAEAMTVQDLEVISLN